MVRGNVGEWSEWSIMPDLSAFKWKFRKICSKAPAGPTDEAADSLGLLSCDKEITLRQPNTAVSEANTAVRQWRIQAETRLGCWVTSQQSCTPTYWGLRSTGKLW